MSTTANSTTNLNLLDRLRRTLPDGSVDTMIVEQLTQRCPMLEDAVFREGNLPTGHLFTSRTALPSVSYRKLNVGTAPTKSLTDQVTESCAILDGWSVIDAKLASINGDVGGTRASEDKAFLQAFKNKIETGFFYSSTTATPEQFMGFSPRLNSTTGPAGSQIIVGDSGASGSDQSSIWLVGWGDETVFGITPKGMPSGLKFTDHDLRPWNDANGNPYEAYVGHWEWNVGLCVKDSRFLVRAANVDTSAITADASAGANVIQTMVKMYHKIYDPSAARLAFYVNRTIATYLHLQALEKVKNSTLTIENIGGKPVTMFLGIPVRETDALTITEAAIS